MIDISGLQAGVRTKKPTSVKSFLNRDIKLFGPRLNDRKKERFYNELHTLLSSGVDIRTAFELHVEEAEKKEDKELYESILIKITAGSTLPDAVRATGKFSDYEYFSLRIGEESGRMNEVLLDLSLYYSKKIKQRRKVTSALSYPLIVIGVAVVAVFFMLRFVVPMFGEMLKRFGSELPPLTKSIMFLSEWLGHYGIWFLIIAVLTVAVTWTQRKSEWFRKVSSSFILRTPLIGKIVRKVYVERFAHAMHLLLLSRTNLIDALDLVQKMVGFYPIEKSIGEVRRRVLAGESLHESLGRFSIYPKRMISLIRVAEEVNKVDLMFEKLSRQLSDEIDHETSMLGSIIEPLMILFLGVMVAIILVAMYLPMFKLGTAFE